IERYSAEEPGPESGTYSNPRNIRLTEIFMSRLAKEVGNGGSQFVVIYIPDSTEVKLLRNKHELSDDEKAFRQIVTSLRLPFASLTPVLAETQESLQQLYYDPRVDGHFKAVTDLYIAR